MTTNSFQTMSLDNRGVLIVVEEKHDWVKTSSTGDYILKKLEKPLTYKELLNDIIDYYDVSQEDVMDIIEKTLMTFYAYNIISIDGKCCDNTADYIMNEKNSLQQIWLNITNRCNYNCPQCFAKMNLPNTDLSLQVVKGLAHQIADLNIEEIIISGGEPCLHPHFFEIIKTLKEKNIHIKVLSNGTVIDLDNKILQQLPSYIDDLQISFDGTNVNTHDKIRGNGTYEKAVRALQYFHDTAIRVGIGFTPLIENVSELENLYDFALTYGIDYIHINRPTAPSNHSHYDNKDEFLSANFFECINEQIAKLRQREFRIKEIYRSMRRKFPVIYAAFVPYHNMIDNVKKERCAAGITTLAVMEDGDVYPCVSISINRNPDFSCGNINLSPIIDIHNNARNKMIQSFSVKEDYECKQCIFKYFCGGGCRATNENMCGHDSLCVVLKEKYIDFFKGVSLTNVKALRNE